MSCVRQEEERRGEKQKIGWYNSTWVVCGYLKNLQESKGLLGRQTRIWLYCRQNYKRWLKYLLYVSIPAILYSWIASNFPALKIWEKQNVALKLGDAGGVAQKQDVAPKQENVPQQEEKVFISEKSAREIFAYIETILPLQRGTIIKTSYIGRWVRWKGKIRNILDREGITMISIDRKSVV